MSDNLSSFRFVKEESIWEEFIKELLKLTYNKEEYSNYAKLIAEAPNALKSHHKFHWNAIYKYKYTEMSKLDYITRARFYNTLNEILTKDKYNFPKVAQFIYAISNNIKINIDIDILVSVYETIYDNINKSIQPYNIDKVYPDVIAFAQFKVFTDFINE